MTENEKNFVRAFVDFSENLDAARRYIKEAYGVNSELNEDENSIRLYCENKLDVNNLVSAKKFINEKFDEGFINVIF